MRLSHRMNHALCMRALPRSHVKPIRCQSLIMSCTHNGTRPTYVRSVIETTFIVCSLPYTGALLDLLPFPTITTSYTFDRGLHLRVTIQARGAMEEQTKQHPWGVYIYHNNAHGMHHNPFVVHYGIVHFDNDQPTIEGHR